MEFQLYKQLSGPIANDKDMVQRIQELVAQYINITINDIDKAGMESEIKELIQEINRYTTTVQFDGRNLLDGTLNWSVEYGNDYSNYGNNIINIPSCDFESLYGASEIDYTDMEKIGKAIDKLNLIVAIISEKRDIFKQNTTYFQNRANEIDSLIQSIFYDSNGNELDGEQALKNIKSNNTAIEIVKINQSSISNIIYYMERINEMVTIASNDTLVEEDRPALKNEIDELVKEIDIELSNMEILKKKVFGGAFPYINRTTISLLGINEMPVDSVETAKASLEKIHKAIQKMYDLKNSLNDEIELLETRKNEESDKKLGLEVEINQDLYELNEKYKDKFKVVNGELIYIGTNADEKEWAKELNIGVEE